MITEQKPKDCEELTFYKTCLQSNSVTYAQLLDIIKLLTKDPLLEAEEHSGDLLYEAKKYFMRHTNSLDSPEFENLKEYFNTLFNSVTNSPEFSETA